MELPFLETHEQITGNEATCIFLHKTEAANWQESYCIYKYLTLGRPSISGFESETKMLLYNHQWLIITEVPQNSPSCLKIKQGWKCRLFHSNSQIRSGRKRSTTSRSTQKMSPFKPFPDPRVALLDFTLSNARQLYSSLGPPSGRKGLTYWLFESPGVSIEF